MRTKAFIPHKVFSKKEIEELGVSNAALNRAYLINLNDGESMLHKSVRESMKALVRIEASK